MNLKDARRVKADLDDTIFAYDVNLKDARRVKADLDDTIFAYDYRARLASMRHDFTKGRVVKLDPRHSYDCGCHK